jgi:hypothetical protein
MSYRYDFRRHRRGDTFDGVNFTVLLANEVPVDLTGASIEAQFRYGSKRGELSLTLSTDNGGIAITDDINGKFSLPAFIVDFEKSGEYFYDIQITFPAGTIKTWVSGAWEILDDVTRP